MANRREVVVTGLGVVSCFGNDVDLFYEKLLAGISGVAPISQFSTEGFSTTFAASVVPFDYGNYLEKKQARRVDRYIGFATVAAKKALEYGQIVIEGLDKTRCGVIIGSGMGGMGVFAEGVETLAQKGPQRVNPFFVPYILTNMAGGVVAIDLGFMGPNYSISTACATGNNAIIAAADHIARGEADFMLAGGAEAAVIPMGLAGFCACKALSTRNEDPTRASRPWDKERSGFVMGEGAGVLVLEEEKHAVKRGARILARYMGGGLSCDAHHMTEPHPDGAGVVLCLQHALRNAGLQPGDIQYINAHATSTPAGDMAEIRALQQIFSPRDTLAINATKSMIGHGLGAAGGLEAVVLVKALMEQKIHPTINLENPEEGLGFYAPTRAVDWPMEYALSNSFGFGGHNATIVFGRYVV